MKTLAIRGATVADDNTINAISDATCELFSKIISENNLDTDNIISAIFTMTNDLDVVYPAKCVRENLGYTDIPFLCYQELNIQGSLRKCIRILMLINSELNKKDIKHIYLKEAKSLRADKSN